MTPLLRGLMGVVVLIPWGFGTGLYLGWRWTLRKDPAQGPSVAPIPAGSLLLVVIPWLVLLVCRVPLLELLYCLPLFGGGLWLGLWLHRRLARNGLHSGRGGV